MKISKCSTIMNKGEVEVVEPKSFDELKKMYVRFNEERVRYAVIGGGSNTLISELYQGTIIKLTGMPYLYLIHLDEIYVSAFYPTTKLVYDLQELGYDYSFLAGIPGLIGGAVYNNSGAFGKNIGQYIKYVNYLNTNGDIVKLGIESLLFDYRYSTFKDIEGIIVGVSFEINKRDVTLNAIDEILTKRRAKLPQAPSLGSIFKNNKLLKSWRIIEALGLRGYQIGDAAFSNKHANVIINMKNASFTDIKNLIILAKQKAYEELGILLEEEISIIE